MTFSMAQGSSRWALAWSSQSPGFTGALGLAQLSLPSCSSGPIWDWGGGWQSRVRGSGGLGSSGEACGHCPGLRGNWNLQALGVDARWDEPDEVWGFGRSRLAVWLGTHGHPLWALVGPAESGTDPKVQDPTVSLRGSQTPTLAT